MIFQGNDDVIWPTNIDLLEDGDLIIASMHLKDYDGIAQPLIDKTLTNERFWVACTPSLQDYKGQDRGCFKTYYLENPQVKKALKDNR